MGDFNFSRKVPGHPEAFKDEFRAKEVTVQRSVLVCLLLIVLRGAMSQLSQIRGSR